jgi:hypothetical protein
MPHHDHPELWNSATRPTGRLTRRPLHPAFWMVGVFILFALLALSEWMQ